MNNLIKDIKEEALKLDYLKKDLNTTTAKIMILSSKLLDMLENNYKNCLNVNLSEDAKEILIKGKSYICLDYDNNVWYTKDDLGGWIKTSENPINS